jgi:uridine kinase
MNSNLQPQKRKLIGIIGLKNSGKDTVGDYLVSQFGFTKYA